MQFFLGYTHLGPPQKTYPWGLHTSEPGYGAVDDILHRLGEAGHGTARLRHFVAFLLPATAANSISLYIQ